MKKVVSLLLSAACMLAFSACENASGPAGAAGANTSASHDTSLKTKENGEKDGGSRLVVYFSATGITRSLAAYAADILDADLYEIKAQVPYSTADLDYSSSASRATTEQNDPSARPAIAGSVEDMAQYDTVFLGYPIWHGQAPRIISTFLESYDFSGKAIVPFCTSHSSGIGSSDTSLHGLAADADWLAGQRFAGEAPREEMERWLDGLDLPVETGGASSPSP